MIPAPSSPSSFVLDLAPVHTSCPNQFPTYASTGKKIAIVGEKPGATEMDEGQPFVGGSGSLLFNSLRRYGINRADCYIGNVSTVPLPEVVKKPWENPDIVAGAKSIKADLAQHQPHCVLLAGALALEAAFPGEKKKITDWRGSILSGAPNGICPGVKCIPCFNPAYVCRVWDEWALFIHDIERFAGESNDPTITYTPRIFDLEVKADRAITLLEYITAIPVPVALDIEGGVAGVSCISFATSPTNAFIVPLATYSIVDKARVLRALHLFLSSTTPKILQNQLYDNFVLSWSYKSPIRNVIWDTMLSGWEIYPELPKGLGTQVSIWTREPFYKADRKSSDTQTLHSYCCKDSACTYEIYLRHKELLSGRPDSYAHFRFNMSLLPALLYMEQRGINYDLNAVRLSLTEVSSKLLELQRLIDNHITAVWERHGKRGEKPPSVNINSPKQLAEVLYTRLGYSKQHPKKGRELDRTKVTTNIDALLELRKQNNGPDHEILEHILQWRKQDGLRETLEVKADKDGRVRCGYNIVGTETGRLTCYGSPTGSGANLTTITSSLRRLYVADPNCWFFQCDLAGADGWTVAAHCALRGDCTMLDDYLAGLKPAKIIALIWRHGAIVHSWDRARLLDESKGVSEKDELGWQYFASKRVQHGSNYDLQPATMSLQILKDSYNKLGKTIHVSKMECQLLQDAYFRRYPGIKMWQAGVRSQLNDSSTLPCASGHTRKFFGRWNDQSTHRQAYAHEPQANTTYATNLSLYRLWTDPTNRIRRQTPQGYVTGMGTYPQHPLSLSRTRNSQFRVEPLHHVHDALCGQFRRSDLDFARTKLRDWFANPLTIAGRSITIPFDGQYGPSWGQLGEKYGGGTI